MIKRRTLYEIMGESVNKDNHTVGLRTQGLAFPKVLRSSQVDDWRLDLIRKNENREVKIAVWFPIKSEWVWCDWVKSIFKKKQKINV